MSMDDRKMFAPMRHRESITPESKVFALLTDYDAGTMAEVLADRLVRGQLAVGTRTLVAKRIGEMLDDLEQAGKVERIPDGRYRAVRVKR